jgi:hypothetical protein
VGQWSTCLSWSRIRAAGHAEVAGTDFDL